MLRLSVYRYQHSKTFSSELIVKNYLEISGLIPVTGASLRNFNAEEVVELYQ